MRHIANMDVRSLICCGHRVNDAHMSEADRQWARQGSIIQQDEAGRWYHTGITARDRKIRVNAWNPDTGPWRKGVNY